MSIPVFHDDQHGTAIISAAALLNALTIVGKRIDEVKVVFCGAGAAGIACAEMYLRLGVKREHVLLVDTVGVVYQGRREKMNPYKERFAADTDLRTLEDAVRGADVFVGVSAADQLTPAMLLSMATSPSCSRWRIPTPRSPMSSRPRRGRTSSWPPAGPTTRTRSTTCSASRSSSGAPSTCGRARSTTR
jgi:malate dehydrogenase (oxaloacetate-decarboxylating)(NADP+)